MRTCEEHSAEAEVAAEDARGGRRGEGMLDALTDNQDSTAPKGDVCLPSKAVRTPHPNNECMVGNKDARSGAGEGRVKRGGGRGGGVSERCLA